MPNAVVVTGEKKKTVSSKNQEREKKKTENDCLQPFPTQQNK